AVKRNGFSDDVRVRSEASLPKPVTQYHDAVASLRLFIRRETSPKNRTHAQGLKKIRRDRDAVDTRRIVGPGQVESADRTEHGQFLERLTLRFPVIVVRWSGLLLIIVLIRITLPTGNV